MATTRKNNNGWFYKFADGYFCWYAYKLRAADKKVEEKYHGKVIEEKRG